jgi:hypothetical protein
MWELGEQSFCKDALDNWVLRGLDHGSYSIKAALHMVDPNHPLAKEISPDGHVNPAAVVVKETISTTFTVDLGENERPPKVHWTWPKEGDVVVLERGVDEIEISFNVCVPMRERSERKEGALLRREWGGVGGGASEKKKFFCGRSGRAISAVGEAPQPPPSPPFNPNSSPPP